MKLCRDHTSAVSPCYSDQKIIDRKCDVAKETPSWCVQQRLFSVCSAADYASHSQVSRVVSLCGVTTIFFFYFFFNRIKEVSKLTAAETDIPTRSRFQTLP